MERLSLRDGHMQCVVEVPFELERLFTRKSDILLNLQVSHNPRSIAWLNLKLNDVNKEIREYKRRH